MDAMVDRSGARVFPHVGARSHQTPPWKKKYENTVGHQRRRVFSFLLGVWCLSFSLTKGKVNREREGKWRVDRFGFLLHNVWAIHAPLPTPLDDSPLNMEEKGKRAVSPKV